MLIGTCIAVLMCLANLAMPPRMRLIGVGILLVPQLYVPGSPVSLAVVWTAMTCVAGLTTRGRTRARSPLLVILVLLTSVTGLSLLWALPSGYHLGVVTVFIGVLFIVWLRETIVLATDEPRMLDNVMMWAVPGIAVQSLLVVIFRSSPTTEAQFLGSRIAAVTVGPAAANLYSDSPANVMDPGKAGGLFVNGNVASLFGGVAAVLLCVAARHSGRRWLYLAAAVSLTGSLFTGSKSVFIIGICIALVIVILPRLHKVSAMLVIASIMLATPLIFSTLTGLLGSVAPSFYAASDSSFGTRAQLWMRAAQMFQESPILGTGFGGWVEKIGRVGSRTDLPPHNVLIATWAYSGIVAAALAIVFVVAAMSFGIRVVAAQRTLHDRRTAVLALCTIAWAFLHGMGDNTALYGDRQTMILIAVAFGYLYAMLRATPVSAKDEIPDTAGTSMEVSANGHHRQDRAQRSRLGRQIPVRSSPMPERHAGHRAAPAERGTARRRQREHVVV